METAANISARGSYFNRMKRVFEYIDTHLDANLSLDVLSAVASFSKHHFHRQFAATFGLTIHRYVQLARLRQASWRLVFRSGESVIDIAYGAGYEAPEAFSRTFKQHLGQTPSTFRARPRWETWAAVFKSYSDARKSIMKQTYEHHLVKIISVLPTPIAVMEHRGNPGQLGQTIQKFIAWRKKIGLVPKVSATYTIFRDPEPDLPENFHIELAAGVNESASTFTDGVSLRSIPGGRCAVLRVVGSSDDLSEAAAFLYRDWLPSSGEEARDFPLYCQRITFFPDVPEGQTITDLFLPLQ